MNYSGQKIVDTGLKYVHNDTCYPAIIVIGQLIYALESGDYDPEKTAFRGITKRAITRNCVEIAEDFSKVEIRKTDKPKVGIVGGLYVKYADFGNNHLLDFLV